MPLLISKYTAPLFFVSKHLETIYPVVFRNIKDVNFKRERIELNDGDFLDIDWIKKGNKRLLILCHGLEGNTTSKYLQGMAKAASNNHYDIAALNYRGCSGEINRNFRFYHSGETNDLDAVIQFIISKNHYIEIGLIGFSVGGNIILKYLGEKEKTLSPLIKAAVNFSAPCDLKASANTLAKWHNKLYLDRFLKSLRLKIEAKTKQFPSSINLNNYNTIKNFTDFDERYTAPIHGFQDASDYYKKCSSIHYISKITLPTLLVSALNDPFLSEECYPFEQAKKNDQFFLETPKKGGHCGFYKNNKNGNYWSENRALEFLENYFTPNTF